jgi:hypothetical protein
LPGANLAPHGRVVAGLIDAPLLLLLGRVRRGR